MSALNKNEDHRYWHRLRWLGLRRMPGRLGNDVLCLDIDPNKIELLNAGGVPIHEPGLDEVIKRNVESGRLCFTTDVAASVAHGLVQMIAIGTPSDEDGSADLQYVLAAARNIARHMTDYKVIDDKSTGLVGTADKVRAVIAEELDKRGIAREARQSMTYSVVSNPEFLKEGAAIDDFNRRDRIDTPALPVEAVREPLAIRPFIYGRVGQH